MTNFRFKHFIPQNDILVIPNIFTKYLYDIFGSMLEDETNKKDKKGNRKLSFLV